jgi:tetratricopeptide (TPR) repeat protein
MSTRITQKSFSLLLTSLVSIAALGQGAVTLPRVPSPAATVSQTIGISTVSVKYSRPSVRNREIWGMQVPYGLNIQGFGAGNPAPWRAGANENTVIQFSHPATVEGKPVAAGSYGLFFVVNNDNTGEVILSKDYQSWGSFWYDPKQDLFHAKIQLRDIPQTELLTYDFINITKNSADLVLNWDKKQFPVKVAFDVDEIVMANAAQELKGSIGFTSTGFSSAAGYAAQNNVHLEDGLTWIDKAIATNKTFTTLSIKANILKETGKAEEAEKIMKDATVLASENELNNYGYQLIAEKKYDQAIEILILNTQRNPQSPNVWDSLGEAYATKGDKKNAIINFKKSLSMNPPENVRANSEKFLKQLGTE